jgi:hypothetical protein
MAGRGNKILCRRCAVLVAIHVQTNTSLKAPLANITLELCKHATAFLIGYAAERSNNLVVEFRRDTDQALEHLGMYPIEYSVPARTSGGISDPEYVANLENFAELLREQPEVVHVYSFSDIMKRLNKNPHGDDPSYYQTPNNRDEAAQYLLLYELSLPYGLDLNDRVNIDKSAIRLWQ